jgi:hypothetical protein
MLVVERIVELALPLRAARARDRRAEMRLPTLGPNMSIVRLRGGKDELQLRIRANCTQRACRAMSRKMDLDARSKFVELTECCIRAGKTASATAHSTQQQSVDRDMCGVKMIDRGS